MGSVKQQSNIRNILGIHVRVFYSLALICALEVLLWSCCLFATQSSGAAQAYYTRETVNLKSTTGQTCRVPVPVIDFRGLALALKAESAWQQRALASVYTGNLPRPSKPSQTPSAQTRSLPESSRDTDGDPTVEGISLEISGVHCPVNI